MSTLETNAREHFGDRAAAIEPGDNFLPKITAFGKRDRFLVTPNFLRQVFLGDVEADDGKAFFDANGFQGLRAACGRAKIAQRVKQRFISAASPAR